MADEEAEDLRGVHQPGGGHLVGDRLQDVRFVAQFANQTALRLLALGFLWWGLLRTALSWALLWRSTVGALAKLLKRIAGSRRRFSFSVILGRRITSFFVLLVIQQGGGLLRRAAPGLVGGEAKGDAGDAGEVN